MRCLNCGFDPDLRPDADEIKTWKDYKLNISQRRFFIGEHQYNLTTMECIYLAAFISAKGRYVTADYLYRYAYDHRPEAKQPDSRVVHVFLSRLRAKLGNMRTVIEGAYGIGYRLKGEPLNAERN